MSKVGIGQSCAPEFFDYPSFPVYPDDMPTRDDHMTIAAGFKCKDSVIICADRELTTSSGKLLKGKTWHQRNKDLAVVVTGAGKFAHLESAATKITQRLRGVSDINGVEKIVRAIFKYVIKEEFFSKPGCPAGLPFDLIVGVSTKTDIDIIRIEQGVLRCGRTKELAGAGAHIADYFFGQYYHPPVAPIDGMTLGAYIIYSVKKSGLGCGGPTDLWLLEEGANAAPYSVPYSDSIFQALRIPFRDLLYVTANIGLPDEKFGTELDRICRLTKQFRTSSLPNWKRARRGIAGLPK
jgi:20S proteasome alpha/beta subunit